MRGGGKTRTCVRQLAGSVGKSAALPLLCIACATLLIAAYANQVRTGSADRRGAPPAPVVSPAVPSATSSANSNGIGGWAGLNTYRESDAKLGPPAENEKRVVFFGDSITQFWPTQGKFFPGRSYINRGISGQSTSQMLLRFREDVIALGPQVVVILGGINDIAGDTGTSSPELTLDNLVSMAELARAHGIRPVLSSITPAKAIPWNAAMRPAPEIARANRLIRAYCERNGIAFIDYYSAMAGRDGGMRPGLSNDGVHPNAAGYAAMEPLAKRALSNALAAGI
jgi:lysophospholipase L1-like esterase